MEQSIRLGMYPQQDPGYFPCVFPNIKFDHKCAYPGVQAEIVSALIRDMGYELIPVYAKYESELSNVDYDISGDLGGQSQLERDNYSTSLPIMYNREAVITTDRPIEHRTETFGFSRVFDQPLWLAVVLLFFINRYYALVLKMGANLVGEIRLFRPTFTATLLPTALGLMLMTGLYRGGLLAEMITKTTTYQVMIK